MEAATIIPVNRGMVNAYVVRQKGTILIDTGTPGSECAILSALEQAGIDKAGIRLIILTHGHGDHAGSAAKLRELTGAEIVIHRMDAGMLRTGMQGPLVPTGFFGWIAKFFIGRVNYEKYPAAEPDIVISETMDLAPFGVTGIVLPTPGHTGGSVSVVLGSGEVFVGDLIFPQIPSGKPGMPFWAEKPADISPSVRGIFTKNPHIFYPGHGGPFPSDTVRGMIAEPGK